MADISFLQVLDDRQLLLLYRNVSNELGRREVSRVGAMFEECHRRTLMSLKAWNPTKEEVSQMLQKLKRQEKEYKKERCNRYVTYGNSY